MSDLKNKWNDLEVVYNKCRELGLSFSLNYTEADNTWYFIIEDFVGKSRDFDFAVSSVVEWLNDYANHLSAVERL
jgi:hypothetical protein